MSAKGDEMSVEWIKFEEGKFPPIDAPVVWVYSEDAKEVMAARPDKFWYCGSAAEDWVVHGGSDDGSLITGVTHYRPIERPDPP